MPPKPSSPRASASPERGAGSAAALAVALAAAVVAVAFAVPARAAGPGTGTAAGLPEPVRLCIDAEAAPWQDRLGDLLAAQGTPPLKRIRSVAPHGGVCDAHLAVAVPGPPGPPLLLTRPYLGRLAIGVEPGARDAKSLRAMFQAALDAAREPMAVLFAAHGLAPRPAVVQATPATSLRTKSALPEWSGQPK